MTETEGKSLEELQKLKLESEIDKNKAEAKKAANEALVFQRQSEDRWYSKKNVTLIASGITTSFALWGLFRVIVSPVVNLQEDTREWQIKKTEAENQYYAAEFKNIKKERDELDSLRSILAGEKKSLLSQVDSMKVINLSNIKNTRELQNKYAKMSAEYTRLSKTQDITVAEKRRLEKLSNEAQVKNDNLRQQITRLASEKASLEHASQQIKTIDVSTYLETFDVYVMLKEKNYYDSQLNPDAPGAEKKFELQQDGKVVYDDATGLTWQRSGSFERTNFETTYAYINQLKQEKYAGYSDWRLPTLKEAMSLMEPKKNQQGWHIDAVFGKQYQWIWTSDRFAPDVPWVVDFSHGLCASYYIGNAGNVRAIR